MCSVIYCLVHNMKGAERQESDYPMKDIHISVSLSRIQSLRKHFLIQYIQNTDIHINNTRNVKSLYRVLIFWKLHNL